MNRRITASLVVTIMIVVSLCVPIMLASCAQPSAPTTTTTPTTPTESFVLKYADTSSPTTTRTKMVEKTLVRIETETKGRVKFERYWSGTLIPKAMDIYPGVKGGLVDLGYTMCTINYANQVPVWQFAFLPTLPSEDLVAASQAMFEMYQTIPELKAELDNLGMKSLYFFGFNFSTITKKPFRTLEDLKGVRVRAVGSGVVKWFTAAGATSVPISAYEAYEALQKGALDGIVQGVYFFYDYKFHELAKYIMNTPISNLMADYGMNTGTWNKLPSDIQKIIDAAFMDLVVETAKAFRDDEVAQLKEMEAAGVQVIRASPSEYERWRKLSQPIWDEYYADMTKRGVDGKKIVAEYVRLYNKYAKK